jgi:anti-sigma regulatory factor (Ser/Thr protein kinase)
MTAEAPLPVPARPDDGAARTAAVARLLLEQRFDADTLYLLRAAVLAHATAAGIPEHRATDVVLAAHELAANAVRHGAGAGMLSMRAGPGILRCQVEDADAASRDGSRHGLEGERAAGGGAWPWPYREGHGLWLVREVADQFSIVPWRDGFQATAVFTLPATQAAPCTADRHELL